MAEVKILIEGYTSADTADTKEERTCPTITLVKDNGLNIIVDPGVLESQQLLIDALKEEGLAPDNIDIVFITHSHIDHYRNIGMFAKAKTLEYFGLWNKNTVEDWQSRFSDDIEIVKTPGHNYDGLTMLVRTDQGKVAICGDVFWKEGLPETDPYASEPDKLQESRKKIKDLADWVIPGHGPRYKTK